MNAFFAFLASRNGRITRAVAGVVLIVLGLLMGSTGGIIIAVIGVAPLAAGVFDFCLFAPLFRLPFNGEALRNKLSGK